MNRLSPLKIQHGFVEKMSALGEGSRGEGGRGLSFVCIECCSQARFAATKEHFTVKKIRVASPDELLHLTGLVPGSIPPFGHPLLPFALVVDPSILDNESIAFNAGSLTDSIIMPVVDYLRIARPSVFPLSSGHSFMSGQSDSPFSFPHFHVR